MDHTITTLVEHQLERNWHDVIGHYEGEPIITVYRQCTPAKQLRKQRAYAYLWSFSS